MLSEILLVKKCGEKLGEGSFACSTWISFRNDKRVDLMKMVSVPKEEGQIVRCDVC